MSALASPVPVVSAEERKESEQIVRKRIHPRRLVERARIILLSAQGQGLSAIARRLAVAENTVRRWRAQWAKPVGEAGGALGGRALERRELRCPARGASGKRTLRPQARGFTGADRDRTGRLEEADRGTVLLDEIGDMAPACQAKLVRALDYGKIPSLGGNEVRRVAARILGATH